MKLKRLFLKLKNKYVLTSMVFIVWLAFFDRNDIVTQISIRHKLHKLENEKQYYLNEISNNKENLNELVTNMQNLEKFGRENYLMKKSNEEVFVFVKK